MKIAIMFGSFNPITNAHVAAMKSAISALNADRGLFVATSDQYLRKKAIKLNDPFYLSEEERKDIILKICESEKNLDFWGFELGDTIPLRYKTICKIRSQYPDCTFFEIQGADKVRSSINARNAEEYVGNTSFAIIARNGIDVQQMIESSPVASQYRDHFILLPQLEQDAALSSSEVRRRFRSGEDYSALIPKPAADVLKKYVPSDFTITFAQKMESLMRSGRFGIRAAGKEVYKANAAIFSDWKNGSTEFDLGDYQAFLDNTKFYSSEYSVADIGTTYPSTETGCISIDCVDLAQWLIADGYNPAILNLASAKSPGGGYHEGYAAQEESLCHSSNLSVSLYQFGNPKLKHIRECGIPQRNERYPLDRSFGGIYTPDVTFFRNQKSKFFALRDTTFKCDVITVAALSFTGRTEFSGKNELSYRSESGGFTPEGEAIMLNKIRTILRMGVEHGKDSLVLGAFGCGAFKLPVPEVARQFRTVISEPEFANKFRLIAFAILEGKKRPNGIDGKFSAFYKEFGTYTIE